MAFFERLREAQAEAATDDPADRIAKESRFRRYNRPWYDALTAMTVHSTRTGTCWVTAREVHDALGIPEHARRTEARRVAHALTCLGWSPANVGPSHRRVRGYVRAARRAPSFPHDANAPQPGGDDPP